MTIQTAARRSSQYLPELAQSLLGAPEVAVRAGLLANAVRKILPETAAAVYRWKDGWTLLDVSEEISIVGEALPDESPRLEPRIYTDLTREDYAHIHVVRTIRALGYLPLLRDGELMGTFEIVSFSEVLTEQSLESLAGLAELAAVALSSAEEYEEQHNNQLDSIHRLTQLYDLEKSLNATLDFEPLLKLIPAKVAAMLPCQAIHLWMFDGGRLRVVSSWGEDGTTEEGTTEEPGEGYVADMAEEAVPVLINEPEDPRLKKRNVRGSGEPLITNALLVPLIEQATEGGNESELGVLEAVNKEGDAGFSEDDLFFMTTMSETVSSALKNASLMYAEKKLEILEALVKVSSEITSTLRLDRLLQMIVNSPQAVLPFERCSIALDQRGRLQLKAVSGLETIPLGDPQVEQLRGLLQSLTSLDQQLLVRQHGDEPETEDPKIGAVMEKYFAASGYRAVFALPLHDDQGRVGLLLYESSDADFLEQAHIEMIKVLAGQTTVAIRNALLYREVPLISLLEPVFQRKQAFLRSERKRQAVILGGIAAVVLLLIFCPLALRLGGAAVVAPQSVVTLAAPMEGTIAQVYAREGQTVRRGQVLATMDDWAWRNQLAAAQAKYNAAMLAMQGDLAHHSAQAGEDRAQAEFLRAEMERTRLRIANAQVRSPIDGVVVTPNLENAAGEHLDAGDTFAQVLDLSGARIDIAIDQQDAPLVRLGQSAAVKLRSFPSVTLHGQVMRLSPEAHAGADGGRVFYAHVLLPNHDAALRAGMEGRAKISAGYRPAGYVLLRGPALWFWGKLWDWIGW
jgi:RND family efflux transporter MFP subunit